MSTKILRYPVDIASIAWVVTTLALQLSAYFLGWSAWFLIPLILLARGVNLVEHNHAHLRIFTNRRANDMFGWLCFLSNGVPLEVYELHHVKNHHRFNNKLGDFSSQFDFTGCEYPDKPVSHWYYTLTFPLITFCTSALVLVRSPGTKIFKRFASAFTVVMSIMVALAIYNPVAWLTFFVVPWIVIYFGLGATNYRHHQGCEYTTDHDASNVMIGLPFGLLGFNIGYHVSHHIKPALHWSLLPEYHASIAHLVPAGNFRPRSAANKRPPAPAAPAAKVEELASK